MISKPWQLIAVWTVEVAPPHRTRYQGFEIATGAWQELPTAKERSPQKRERTQPLICEPGAVRMSISK
jgi:hypothetical protein